MKKSMYKRKNPKGDDIYHTPFSLVWKLLEHEKFHDCLEPACGEYAIVKAARGNPNCDFTLAYDLNDPNTGDDFFNHKKWDGDILTNPPFSLWDEFVTHAKKICSNKICMIGRLNYLGCKGRSKSGIWEHLKKIYVFNRYVDFRTPFREDGHFHVGGMCSGWFLWDMQYTGPHMFEILDVSEYATLGNFKKKGKK